MAFGKKIRACLTAGMLAGGLLLSGCTAAPLLSQREIVRAAFFQQQGARSAVFLLLADSAQNAEGQQPAYKVVTGHGDNPEQALEKAENSLEGQVFYGLLDLATFPTQYNWQNVVDTARLLYDKTKPAPQMILFLMDEMPEQQLVKNAGDLYEEMEKAQVRYDLKNGLQTVFSEKNECALPVWQGTEYGFSFLQKDKEPLMVKEAIAAQLAAVLSEQSDRLECLFDQESAALQTQTYVQYCADQVGQNELRLTLIDPEIRDISGEGREPVQLQQLLCNELQQVFADFTRNLYTDQFDPFRIGIWVAAQSGSQKPVPQPSLMIHLEP